MTITVIVLLVMGALVGGWQSRDMVAQLFPTRTPIYTSTPISTLTRTITDTLLPTKSVQPTNTFTPTIIPALGIGSTFTRVKDGMVMVYIPEGEFLMGSDPAKDKNTFDDEQPQHNVYLGAYWIDQTEVTNAMYKICVDEGGCAKPSSSRYDNPFYKNYPVVRVDWNEAKAYCAWAGSDLPTEAQWEKAARGTDGRVYPWGNDPPTCDLANINNCIGNPKPVMSYEGGKSPYGTYDMTGNVWEWVDDWFTAYPGNTKGNSDYGTTYRVLRGGSWGHNKVEARSAYRPRLDPSSKNPYNGFRCANPIPTSTTPVVMTPQPTPIPIANALPVEITDPKGIVMRLVPAGSFTMGSDSGNFNEKPAHTVSLDDYYMDVYETTYGNYKACVDAGVCTPPSKSTYGYPSLANYPVGMVDWYQSKTYCEWRGARLPTEAEWEKAARGTDGRTYPWGEGAENFQKEYVTYIGNISKIGMIGKDVSPYGMYDMADNVDEWVNDWYSGNYYQSSPEFNPQGPPSGVNHILRGVTTSQRVEMSPDLIRSYWGFRCARDAMP
jgi:formylglycine-generating enzyme required for sulfatase activity